MGAETGQRQVGGSFDLDHRAGSPGLPGTEGMTTPPLYNQFSAHEGPFGIYFEMETKFPNLLNFLIHPCIEKHIPTL